MLIRKLTLTNFRGYSQAEFKFQSGINLLVGINGVGKTSVLDALRVCLSAIYQKISETKQKKESFTESDIKIGAGYLQVSCDFTYLQNDYNLLIVERRHTIVKVEKEKPGERDVYKEVPERGKITPQIMIGNKNYSNNGNDPIGIFFSTKRSLLEDRSVSKTVAQAGRAAAHAEALSGNRFFNLKVFIDWYKVQKALSTEDVQIGDNLAAITKVVESFLPGFSNLREIQIKNKLELWIDKNNVPLNVKQLSDGEKGMLSVAIEIARRLVLANPIWEDPIKLGDGVVLIDELDLHLHPKWQRSIVANLTKTFPQIQFIATTHSPQIIPSLEPERIQIIDFDKVSFPDRSLGMDTNWILKYLMESDDRPENAIKAIAEIDDLIKRIKFDKARSKMRKYKKEGLDLPEWSVFEARIARLEIIDNK